MNSKEQITAPTVAASPPPPPRAADVTPPAPLPALESLSPPSPPSRMGNLLPWLGFTLVVALLAVLLVRQHRDLSTPKDLSEPARKTIETLLGVKVSGVEAKIASMKDDVKSAISDETKKAKETVDEVNMKLSTAKDSVAEIEKKVAEIEEKAADALEKMDTNVGEFNKAKTTLDAFTTVAGPFGPKMDSLNKSFSSLQEYLESLHTVDHEAVIVICNGNNPSPARLESGLKEFIVSCPFPKLYNKYRWTILEKHGTKALEELAASPVPGEKARTDLKLSNTGDAAIELGKLDDDLDKWLKARTDANSTKPQRNLILLISENTHYVDFVPPEGFLRLNILLCLNGEPDAGKLMEWLKLCRKHHGVFDYVRLASSAPAASTPASGAASTKGDDKQAGATTPPNATAPVGPDKSPADDPQAYALQFLLRVCQPLPNSR